MFLTSSANLRTLGDPWELFFFIKAQFPGVKLCHSFLHQNKMIYYIYNSPKHFSRPENSSEINENQNQIVDQNFGRAHTILCAL